MKAGGGGAFTSVPGYARTQALDQGPNPPTFVCQVGLQTSKSRCCDPRCETQEMCELDDPWKSCSIMPFWDSRCCHDKNRCNWSRC